MNIFWWSLLVRLSSQFLHAAGYLGKKKAGFRFAVPRFGMLGKDILGWFFNFYVSLSFKADSPVSGVSFASAEGAVSKSTSNFNQALRVLLRRAGVLEPDASEATSYCLRGVQPTIADL